MGQKETAREANDMTSGAMTFSISLTMILFGVWVFLDNRFGLILIMFGVAVMYSEYRRWKAEMECPPGLRR
jgi:hypothetical protein